MKNIHLLPTEKTSKLYTIKGKYYIEEYPLETVNAGNQYIYITSNEEIKEGDWFYNIISLKPEPFKACENGDGYVNCSKYSHYRIDCKKIILTTDQDLIADGVQAIDDEFLEWFVKNPSCEEVEIEEICPLTCCIQKEGKTKMNNGCMERNRCLIYKIIIPQEKPKPKCVTGCKHFSCGEVKHHKDCFYYRLQEAAEKMYSEEEVENIITKLMHEVQCNWRYLLW
jgi:hypothetical protein